MAEVSGEQKAEVEAMIAAALTKQESEIGAKLNLLIAQAESKYSELQSDMDRSKELKEVEVKGLMGAEAKVSALLVQQNALSHSCKFARGVARGHVCRDRRGTKDLERRAAGGVAEQQTGIETIFAGLEAKLQVSFAV